MSKCSWAWSSCFAHLFEPSQCLEHFMAGRHGQKAVHLNSLSGNSGLQAVSFFQRKLRSGTLRFPWICCNSSASHVMFQVGDTARLQSRAMRNLVQCRSKSYDTERAYEMVWNVWYRRAVGSFRALLQLQVSSEFFAVLSNRCQSNVSAYPIHALSITIITFQCSVNVIQCIDQFVSVSIRCTSLPETSPYKLQLASRKGGSFKSKPRSASVPHSPTDVEYQKFWELAVVFQLGSNSLPVLRNFGALATFCHCRAFVWEGWKMVKVTSKCTWELSVVCEWMSVCVLCLPLCSTEARGRLESVAFLYNINIYQPSTRHRMYTRSAFKFWTNNIASFKIGNDWAGDQLRESLSLLPSQYPLWPWKYGEHEQNLAGQRKPTRNPYRTNLQS